MLTLKRYQVRFSKTKIILNQEGCVLVGIPQTISHVSFFKSLRNFFPLDFNYLFTTGGFV